MKIRFTKINNNEHELRVERDSGEVEALVSETRSLLVHDLTHLAFEMEASENLGFWGRVASGHSISELSDKESISKLDDHSEILQIEKAVAIFQGLAKGLTIDSIIDGYHQQPANFAWAKAEWFEATFVARVNKRLQSLLGQWRATKFGESMDIKWNLGD